MPLAIRSPDRRSPDRVQIEIHSREDARRFVEVVQGRNVENSAAVKAWRTAKDSTWLLLLVAAFLLFYLVSVLIKVFSLV